MGNAYKTKTQVKREKYNYRAEYLNHNKGILGFIYICSQCGRPMTRNQLQVDHIAPISRMGLNHKINCVAICPKCNRKKSNRYGVVTVKGLIAKVFEEAILIVQKLTLYALMGLIYVIKLVFNLLLMPVVNAKSLLAKVGIIALYVVVINWLVKSYTGVNLLGVIVDVLP